MPRSNLSFLGKYRKDELVRYLASLHLYAQNSSNILRPSMMVYEALCGKGGRKHLLTSSLYPCHEMALLKISGFGIEKW